MKSTSRHSQGFSHRPDRRPHLRRVSGASRAGGLYRHLRARASDGRRARIPSRRHRTGARAERAGHPLSRRQFRLRLQLGRRDRAEGEPAGHPRLCLAHQGNQRGRHRRIRGLVRGGGHRADARRQSRLTRPRRGARASRILQSPERQPLERPAHQERPARALQRPSLVSRQRDGRAVAGGAQDRLRIWQDRQRDGQGDEGVRPARCNSWPAAARTASCRPIRNGRPTSSTNATRTSIICRSTCISRTTRTTISISSPSR